MSEEKILSVPLALCLVSNCCEVSVSLMSLWLRRRDFFVRVPTSHQLLNIGHLKLQPQTRRKRQGGLHIAAVPAAYEAEVRPMSSLHEGS
jgi:hypothetical protein